MAPPPSPRAVPLTDLDASEAERFGGKSAVLGELLRAGIPVPPGFALSTAAFEEFIAAAGLDRDGEDLAAKIAAAPVPATTRAEIERLYAELAERCGDPEPPVAVRSSARGEDSEEATFAGQQETILWVRGAPAICEAVRRCWASLYSAPAISYRARIAPGAAVPAMGVTVQLMVDAAVAGVLFTCSPLTGDRSVIVIDASWGLGLSVVGGEVTPDQFVLSKVTGEVLRRTINRKHLTYVPPGPEGGEPRAVPVAPELREVACLDRPQLEELAALGRLVERHFGRPQDVEWAIAQGSGELAVLQARPVTVVPSPQTGSDPEPGSALSLVMRSFGAGERGQR